MEAAEGNEHWCVSCRVPASMFCVVEPLQLRGSLVRLKTTHDDALELQGVVHVLIRVGKKTQCQAPFLVSNPGPYVICASNWLHRGT